MPPAAFRFTCGVLALSLSSVSCERGARFRDSGPPPFDPGPVPAELAGGAKIFASFCAGCHGTFGVGYAAGPPLLDTLYLAPAFADTEIRHAVVHGVRRHRWSFGDMPALSVVSPSELTPVIAYVRWLQERWLAMRR